VRMRHRHFAPAELPSNLSSFRPHPLPPLPHPASIRRSA
jgi:hypothetical protein